MHVNIDASNKLIATFTQSHFSLKIQLIRILSFSLRFPHAELLADKMAQKKNTAWFSTRNEDEIVQFENLLIKGDFRCFS